jgi:hypothetical protein
VILDAIWDHHRSFLSIPFNLVPASVLDANANAQIPIKECVNASETLTLTTAREDISKRMPKPYYVSYNV